MKKALLFIAFMLLVPPLWGGKHPVPLDAKTDPAKCLECHTAHGMGSMSGNITGERMVNFDVNVVAPNGAAPISYSHAANTCTLACHGYNHNSNGTVTAIPLPTGAAQARITR